MNKRFIWIIGAFLMLAMLAGACKRTTKDGFNTTASGLKYKFHVQGEKDTLRVNQYDIVYVRMDYRAADTLFFSSGITPISFQVNPVAPGDLQEGLMMMKVGDSATFAMAPEKFFINMMKYKELPEIYKKYPEIFFDIKVVAYIPEPPAMKQERADTEVRKTTESDVIKQYVQQNNITVAPKASGLYYIELVKGQGKQAEAGKKLTVHYKGMLLDGTLFDSSYDRGRPVNFVLGQGERIPAWDEGFAMMAEGGTARFIVPSVLGYGAEQRGGVKPYTPIIFEVELIKVDN